MNRLDFRKFDDGVEVWGPDESNGHWFCFGKIFEGEFYPSNDEDSSIQAISLGDLKQIVAYMEKQL